MTVRTTPRRRATMTLVGVLCGALVLGGCAAGQDAATANQQSVVDGGSGDVGSIALRNVGIAAPSTVDGYAAGQQAQLVVSIVNNGTSTDALTSVTTDAASAVQVSASGADSASPVATSSESTNSPSSSTSVSASASPSESSPSASGAATSGATTSGATTSGATTSGAAAAASPITVPANTLVRVGAESGPTVTLTDLKNKLISGQTISVTFTFRSAGSVTIRVPVKLIVDSTGGQSADIQPTGEG